MSIDYGARTRAICDYLETVPGEKYDFMVPPNCMEDNDGCGCVVGHGFEAGLIDSPIHYDQCVRWMTGLGISEFGHVIGLDGMESGEASKQAAIKNLCTWADEHYPVTTKETAIPDSVLAIFNAEAVAK